MVPGSIADYLQAADLAGLMFGLAVALWASMKKEPAGRESGLGQADRSRSGAQIAIGCGLSSPGRLSGRPRPASAQGWLASAERQRKG